MSQNPDWVSIAIALAIVGAVLFVYLRGRQTPAGASAAQVNKLFSMVRALESKIGDTATASELDLIRAEIRRVEGSAASPGMVTALEGKLNRMEERLSGSTVRLDEKIAAVKETADHTRHGVERIEAILMRGALEK